MYNAMLVNIYTCMRVIVTILPFVCESFLITKVSFKIDRYCHCVCLLHNTILSRLLVNSLVDCTLIAEVKNITLKHTCCRKCASSCPGNYNVVCGSPVILLYTVILHVKRLIPGSSDFNEMSKADVKSAMILVNCCVELGPKSTIQSVLTTWTMTSIRRDLKPNHHIRRQFICPLIAPGSISCTSCLFVHFLGFYDQVE